MLGVLAHLRVLPHLHGLEKRRRVFAPRARRALGAARRQRRLRRRRALGVLRVPARDRGLEVPRARVVRRPRRVRLLGGVRREFPRDGRRDVAVGLHRKGAPLRRQLDFEDDVRDVVALRRLERDGGDGERGVRVPALQLLTVQVPLVPAAQVLRLLRLPPLLGPHEHRLEPARRGALEVERQQTPLPRRHPETTHAERVVRRVRSLEDRLVLRSGTRRLVRVERR